MTARGSQRIVIGALALPPVTLSCLLFLLPHVTESVQTPLLTAILLLSPLAAFIELAALVVAFSRWRSGHSLGVFGFVGIVIGACTLVGAICLVGLLLGGGGGI